MDESSSERLATLKARQVDRWQRRLLPFVIISIVLMGAFFFASSLVLLSRFNDAVAYKPDTRVAESIAAFERANPEAAREESHLNWKTLVFMEENTFRQRYAQVNATLMLRAWTRHLGFLTGMILSLVGAIFVLAKLSETESKLAVESAGVKASLATASPGILLAVLGTGLMAITLTASFEFSTNDVPVYFPPRQAAAAESMPPPALLREEERKSEEEALFGQETDHAPAAPRR